MASRLIASTAMTVVPGMTARTLNTAAPALNEYAPASRTCRFLLTRWRIPDCSNEWTTTAGRNPRADSAVTCRT